MHGQKKRRKRTAAGSLDIDGTALRWQLISEPQWTSEGSKGLCFSVTGESEHTLRELVLEYPFEQTGWRPQLPSGQPSPPRCWRRISERQLLRAGIPLHGERHLCFLCRERLKLTQRPCSGAQRVVDASSEPCTFLPRFL